MRYLKKILIYEYELVEKEFVFNIKMWIDLIFYELVILRKFLLKNKLIRVVIKMICI